MPPQISSSLRAHVRTIIAALPYSIKIQVCISAPRSKDWVTLLNQKHYLSELRFHMYTYSKPSKATKITLPCGAQSTNLASLSGNMRKQPALCTAIIHGVSQFSVENCDKNRNGVLNTVKYVTL